MVIFLADARREQALDMYRNIGIMAHIDAGKVSLGQFARRVGDFPMMVKCLELHRRLFFALILLNGLVR